MKVLIVQLARIGDILQTWPTINALKRDGHEVHLLVRARFKAATIGVEVDQVKILNTKEVLEPLIAGDVTNRGQPLSESIWRIESLIQDLRSERYDKVLNFSFSPVSASLVAELERSDSKLTVVGYSRHLDRSLSLKNDLSAFFFAQIGKTFAEKSWNQVPLSFLYAAMAGVELHEVDWKISKKDLESTRTEGLIAVHLGGSESHKTINTISLAKVFNDLKAQTKKEFRLILIGSAEEKPKAVQFMQNLSPELRLNTESRVGETRLEDVWTLVGSAQLLVAPDSMTVHMANLLDVPCVNLSTPLVNSDETGPLSRQSRVIRVQSGSLSDSEIKATCTAINSVLLLTDQVENSSGKQGPLEEFRRITDLKSNGPTFMWALLQTLYLGREWQDLNFEFATESQDASQFVKSFQKIVQDMWNICQVEKQQLQVMKERPEQVKLAAQIIEQADSLARELIHHDQVARVVLSWWLTEKFRLPPGSVEVLLKESLRINADFELILRALDDRLFSFQNQLNNMHTVTDKNSSESALKGLV